LIPFLVRKKKKKKKGGKKQQDPDVKQPLRNHLQGIFFGKKKIKNALF
jgi:hypothetical protein